MIKALIILGNLNYPYGSAPTNRIHAYARSIKIVGIKTIIISYGFPFNEKMAFSPKGMYESIEYCYPTNKYIRSKYFLVRNINKLHSWIRSISLLLYYKFKYKEIAILEYSTSIFTEITLFIIGKLLKIPIIREVNEVQKSVRIKKNILYTIIDKNYRGRLFDGIFVISNYLIKEYRKYKQLKMLHIPILVDFDRFINIRSEKSEKYFTYIGEMSREKDGLNILVRAFDIVYNQHNDVFLYLIGHGNNESINKLKEMINSLNCKNNIRFIGKVDRDLIPNYISNSIANVLARPNNIQAKGGFPTKLGEYLATGKPVVVTRVGEIPNYLIDGENAFISEPDSVELFAEKLDYVLDNYSEATQVGEKGKQLAKKYFNYQTQSKRIIDFINTLY